MTESQNKPSNENVTEITAVPVVRDEFGGFHHPDFPWWGESSGAADIFRFFSDRNGESEVIYMEFDADELMTQFVIDEASYAGWNPVSTNEGAFLLSIHDTFDGPVAVFFVPLK